VPRCRPGQWRRKAAGTEASSWPLSLTFTPTPASRARISTNRPCWNSRNRSSARASYSPSLSAERPSGSYEIIAGERRWRAASLAGLTEVPVIVREANDQKVLELAIVENIQREDLNPIELAIAFERMAAELSLSHEEIGQKTGKDRVTVTNSIRLLQLPAQVQELVSTRKLTPGHARALLKLPGEKTQRDLADKCIREGWSVRQIEEFTKPPKETTDEIVARKTNPKPVDPNVRAAITELERVLGTRVRIMEKGRGKGLIELEYYSDEDLDRIYSLIVGPAPTDPAML
jgi:ParB family chromosome partitioning protein